MESLSREYEGTGSRSSFFTFMYFFASSVSFSMVQLTFPGSVSASRKCLNAGINVPDSVSFVVSQVVFNLSDTMCLTAIFRQFYSSGSLRHIL